MSLALHNLVKRLEDRVAELEHMTQRLLFVAQEQQQQIEEMKNGTKRQRNPGNHRQQSE